MTEHIPALGNDLLNNTLPVRNSTNFPHIWQAISHLKVDITFTVRNNGVKLAFIIEEHSWQVLIGCDNMYVVSKGFLVHLTDEGVDSNWKCLK